MKFKLDRISGGASPGFCVKRTMTSRPFTSRNSVGLYDVCRDERRCLVTLDLDFANVLRFPPEPTAGIVVFRPPEKIIVAALPQLARQLLAALGREGLEGRLWIVELAGVRVHQAADQD